MQTPNNKTVREQLGPDAIAEWLDEWLRYGHELKNAGCIRVELPMEHLLEMLIDFGRYVKPLIHAEEAHNIRLAALEEAVELFRKEYRTGKPVTEILDDIRNLAASGAKGA